MPSSWFLKQKGNLFFFFLFLFCPLFPLSKRETAEKSGQYNIHFGPPEPETSPPRILDFSVVCLSGELPMILPQCSNEMKNQENQLLEVTLLGLPRSRSTLSLALAGTYPHSN
jgi:hypothetical protein